MHCVALKTGMDLNPVTSNSLLSMYDKSGNVDFACQVFDTMPERDTISWNAMVNCYIRNGLPGMGLSMVRKMYSYGFFPKPELLARVLSVCQEIGVFRFARAVHAISVVNDMCNEEKSVFMLTALVELYMRFGESSTARRIFDQMTVRNEVSWSAIIARCSDNGECKMAIDCLRTMPDEGIKPNRVSLISIMSACAEVAGVKQAREIHGYAFRHGFDSDCCFSGSFIHMYSHFGKNAKLCHAKLIFERVREKDIFLWSSMIGLYCRRKNTAHMMKLFKQMREEGIEPNSITLLSLLSAFASTSSLNHGFSIHGFSLKCGMDLQIPLGNSLITMYGKTGSLDAAQKVFQDMPTKDSVSWTALIHAYALNGHGSEALQLFFQMKEKCLELDQTSFLVAVSACNHDGLVEEGKKIFTCVKNEGKLQLAVEHYACFINLLAKSGQLEEACNMANSMPLKPSDNIWSSLITALKTDGRLEEAERLAHRLIESKPDHATNYTVLGSVYAESGNWPSMEKIRKHARL
ncbi:hypothetical protein QQ045_020916 [Rhodiola kirilowii]